MKFSRIDLISTALLLGAALILASLVALLSPGEFAPGWAAATLLFFLSGLGLFAAWRWAGRGRRLAGFIVFAFLLHLASGIGLSLAYQNWGYDEPVYQAGYLFPDAMKRDTEAYQVGVSDVRLLFNPELTLSSDQYGGLGLFSAAVYRYLSPDAHRPFLMLIIGAFFFALGVPFLIKAVELRWSTSVATLTAWIYILYPDGIFFTSSQMREPYMLGLSAAAFWAVLAWGRSRRAALSIGLPAVVLMFLFSTRSAVFLVGMLAFLFLLEYVTGRPEKIWKIAGWAGLTLGAVLSIGLTWAWFRDASGWDLLLTQRGSGIVETRLQEIGGAFRIPFIAAMGLAQPVLPAAITETKAIPLAKTIVLLRSLGWYILAPLLLYVLFSLGRIKDKGERARMIWALAAVLAWACVASLRAGGDMTDNPRYRVLFLIWMALAAAWAIDWARTHHDAWLARLLVVEAIFLGFFTAWYANRYQHWPFKLPFFWMVALIIGLSALVLIGGYLYDRRRIHHPPTQ
jgi:hypothetical protein